MTSAQPPRSDKQLSRDVARLIDRRRVRRRVLVWTVLLAIVAAAAFYVRCGSGLGLGGTGQGIADLGQADSPAAPRRCAIRVTAGGITVDGKRMSRDEAVAACKAAGAADAVITGDAREGDWKDLRAALETAGVKDISVR